MTRPEAPVRPPVAPPERWVSVDGLVQRALEARLPLDRGLMLGDGCFETVLVRGGQAVALDRHLARLATSLEALGLAPASIPPGAGWLPQLGHEVEALLSRTAPASPHVDLALRLTVTAQTRLLELGPLPASVVSRRSGIELHTLPEPRADALLHRHKTLAWSWNAVAARLHRAGASPRFEGLWLDPAGHLLEGTRSNVFAVFADRVGVNVVTPPLTSPILPGTARARAIPALRALGVPVTERPLHRDELGACRGLFVTSSLLPVAAVSSLDDAPLPAPPLDLSQVAAHLLAL